MLHAGQTGGRGMYSCSCLTHSSIIHSLLVSSRSTPQLGSSHVFMYRTEQEAVRVEQSHDLYLNYSS